MEESRRLLANANQALARSGAGEGRGSEAGRIELECGWYGAVGKNASCDASLFESKSQC